MALEVSSDLPQILVFSGMLGAAGGFTFDVVTPLKARAGEPSVAFDNRIDRPRRLEDGGYDFGFIGPMLVGAVAAVAAVLAVGVSRPTTAAVVEVDRLIWLALVGGFGGSAVLQALRQALIGVIEKRAQQLLDEVRDETLELLDREVRSRLALFTAGQQQKVLDPKLEEDITNESIRLADSISRRASRRTQLSLRTALLAGIPLVALAGLVGGAAFAILDDDGPVQVEQADRVATPEPVGETSREADETQGNANVDQPEDELPGRKPIADLVIDEVTQSSVTVTNTGGAEAGSFVVSVAPEGVSSFRVDFLDGLAIDQTDTGFFECVEGEVTVALDVDDAVDERDEDDNDVTAGPFADCPEPTVN
jgi:hypothetical protein